MSRFLISRYSLLTNLSQFQPNNSYKFNKIHTKSTTQILDTTSSKYTSNRLIILALLLGGGVTLYLYTKRESKQPNLSTTNIHTQQTFHANELVGDSKLTKQERIFAENSTYLYQGVLYMSPASFIRLVTQVPTLDKNAHSVNKVDTKQVNKWSDLTSSNRERNHEGFLKNIWNDGILSYPDYRFLVSTLAKCNHHFKIAFSIYDRDCNGCIELSEFIQVQNSMLGNVPELLDPRTTGVQSSLLVHLFGTDGKGTLSFDEFSTFIDAFQKEVLLYEFNVYAKGNKTISGEDFAKLIMRYSCLSMKEIKSRLYRNYSKNAIPEFDLHQYERFCDLLLNIEDLSTVVSIYTVDGKGVNKREFNHAVEICCGDKFDNNLLEILFSIFDIKKDGFLDYQEFLDVLRRWQKRGTFVGKNNWELFTTCFRSKVRAQK
ncbi:Calcium uptake protein 3, mitochondrial-like isoform X2 [Oopsacas minuta]|uniref:Calcium uptake protein 3, mitochondrial-like isoform X2 n=1 Tax=Oopsacas minuta TaxID=111878 RepID=A0AAV7KL96_9METZ|nr:Calcium uptake protein 3, mitochondrial-like isoform X2 [Oopsacas minuta]